MTDTSLKQLFIQHKGKVSQKWISYLTEYDRIFNEFRGRNINFLELGVQNGGSLEIWAKYFPKANKLIGCDIDPNCTNLRFSDSRISIVSGDVNSNTTQARILKHAPVFDLIIDDASHRSSDIIKSFNKYFPKLSDEGIYVVEDTHCSYWSEFEGGLYSPFSTITFFKRLADTINYEHWGTGKSRDDIFLGFCEKYNFTMHEKTIENIHSIEFVNSMCIIRKGCNSLGNLFVAGSEETVSEGHLSMHLREKISIDQSFNEWTSRSIPPDEELIIRINELFELNTQFSNLNRQALEKEQCIQNLNNEALEKDLCIQNLNRQALEKEQCIQNLNNEALEKDLCIQNLNRQALEKEQCIQNLLNSRSWRVTKPLRYLAKKLRYKL